MIFELLTASLLTLNKPALAATPPAGLKQKVETAAKLKTIAKISGTISGIGTNNFVVNGTTVNLTANTVILRRFGGKSNLKEFSVGDEVQVLGKWTSTTQTAVDAKLVRNSSIQKRRGTFVGAITGVTDTGFTFQPLSRPTQTASVSAATKHVDRTMRPIAKASILAGHKVQIKGLWDNKLNTISEISLIKDFSLPPQPRTATPSAKIATPAAKPTLPTTTSTTTTPQ